MNQLIAIITILLITFCHLPVCSETISVSEGESIQSAIDGANDGDEITVSAGTYNEDINFNDKRITLTGEDPSTTTIQGTGLGPVVIFEGGNESIIESFTITGGIAPEGAGICILSSNPTIRNNIITMNQAESKGSGIFLNGTSQPVISKNLIIRNSAIPNGGDPHSLQIEDAAPTIVNNTIAYNDSNGIFIMGEANATIINNILAFNGSMTGKRSVKGRGLCELGGTSTIQHNLFFKNRQAAFFNSSMTDFKKVSSAEKDLNDPRLSNNVDGNPRFQRAKRGNFNLRKKSKAIDNGDPSVEFNDSDGSRNNIGFTGGP